MEWNMISELIALHTFIHDPVNLTEIAYGENTSTLKRIILPIKQINSPGKGGT
jgi:hypothetical protein